jgi:hypothetical protein
MFGEHVNGEFAQQSFVLSEHFGGAAEDSVDQPFLAVDVIHFRRDDQTLHNRRRDFGPCLGSSVYVY